MTRTSAPDELERLRAADPLPTRAAEGAPPETILATIRRRVAEEAAGAPARALRRPGRRRVVAVAVATVLLAGSATIGYALRGGDESLAITCLNGDDGVWVINAVSPDPVADCVARWRAAGETVDPETLTTFVTGDGSIVVAPDQAAADDRGADDEVADHGAADDGVADDGVFGDGFVGDLIPAPGLTINADVAELRMALDDLVTGLDSCYDPDTARQHATEIASNLGFDHWEVVERERPADATCTSAFPDPETQQIVVVHMAGGAPSSGADDPPGVVVYEPNGEPIILPEGQVEFFGDPEDPSPSELYDEIMAVSRAIHDRIDAACLTAAAAEEAVRTAVTGTRWADTVNLTVNTDPDADCARVYTNAYGGYEVTVFGP